MTKQQLKNLMIKYSFVRIFGIRIDLRKFWKMVAQYQNYKFRKAQRVRLEVHDSNHKLKVTFGVKENKEK